MNQIPYEIISGGTYVSSVLFWIVYFHTVRKVYRQKTLHTHFRINFIAYISGLAVKSLLNTIVATIKIIQKYFRNELLWKETASVNWLEQARGILINYCRFLLILLIAERLFALFNKIRYHSMYKPKTLACIIIVLFVAAVILRSLTIFDILELPWYYNCTVGIDFASAFTFLAIYCYIRSVFKHQNRIEEKLSTKHSVVHTYHSVVVLWLMCINIFFLQALLNTLSQTVLFAIQMDKTQFSICWFALSDFIASYSCLCYIYEKNWILDGLGFCLKPCWSLRKPCLNKIGISVMDNAWVHNRDVLNRKIGGSRVVVIVESPTKMETNHIGEVGRTYFGLMHDQWNRPIPKMNKNFKVAVKTISQNIQQNHANPYFQPNNINANILLSNVHSTIPAAHINPPSN
uniref:G_PROTEIN_RECEP_F1_2 domain-containing protein n=1 Tax=Rhabditophanes sp. KR3021 TaxID=114890 RepID=A0AC35UFE0_9BILA